MLTNRSFAVGDELPPFTRQTTIESWNRFAAVNDEFIPIHMDDEAGRQAGNPAGAFGMGNLRLSYLMNLLRDWCSDEGDIRAIDVRYTTLNQKGDVLTAVGTVRDVNEGNDELVVTIDVDVFNQDQVSTAPGRAVVAFPTAGPR